jgi:hypothetical protein
MTTKGSLVQRTPQTLPNRRFVVHEKDRLVAEFGVFSHSAPRGLKSFIATDNKVSGNNQNCAIDFIVNVEFLAKNCASCIARHLHMS